MKTAIPVPMITGLNDLEGLVVVAGKWFLFFIKKICMPCVYKCFFILKPNRKNYDNYLTMFIVKYYWYY